MKLCRILITFALIVSGFPLFAQKKEPDKSYYTQAARFEQVTSGQALGYSMMLPGLGHYKTGEYGWGHFYTLAFMGSLINFNERWVASRNVPSASETSLPTIMWMSYFGSKTKPGDLEKLYYFDTQKHDNKVRHLKAETQNAANLLVFVYLFQAGHAWFSGRKYDPVENWSVFVVPGYQAQATVGYTFRF